MPSTKLVYLNTDSSVAETLVVSDGNGGAKLSSLVLDFTPANAAEKGQPDGYATLGVDGKIPLTQIPSGVGGSGAGTVVADITERDALVDPDQIGVVWVKDASADATVTSGAAEYIYDVATTSWIKIAEAESMDLVIDWDNIDNKPTSSTTDIENAVTNSHTHTNKTTLDKIGEDAGAPTWDGGAWPGAASGDMEKSVYDTNDDGVVDAAAKLQTARTFTIASGATGSGSFDGTADVTIDITLQNVLLTDGSITFTPTNDNDPATKKYVDDNASPLSGWTWDTFTLTSTDITNKSVTLTQNVRTPLTHTVMFVEGAPPLAYGIDFSVTGNTLSWNGLGLDDLIAEGEWVRVGYHAAV